MICLDKATIGNRIRYERQRCGLTLEELGNKIGVSKQCLSGWEHARNMPDIISLKTLADIFQITMEAFLTEIDASDTAGKAEKKLAPQPELTQKEILFLHKLRSLSAERRKALEVLFGIREKK